MKFRKLTLATAVVAAMGVNGVASAIVTGLPGEGLLMPLVVGPDYDPNNNEFVHTFVTLSVPKTIGQDTMINFFTAPNSTAPLTTTEQEPKDARIRWTLFNHLSVRVTDGYCPISPNDVTVWTNDPVTLATQRQQDRAMLGLGLDGIPSNICGAAVTLPFGYIVFQTVEGALGRDADFAMAGDGGFVIQTFVNSLMDGVYGVPVLPMADGADANLDLAPALGNEIIAKSYNTVLEPKEYAPIFAGNRMNDALAPLNGNEVIVQMPIQGPAGNYTPSASMHAFWFDRVASRTVTVDMYDDQEQPCSFTLPMPQEIEIFLPNAGYVAGVKPGDGWDSVSGLSVASQVNGEGFGALGVLGTMVDVTDSVLGDPSQYQMCEPAYWQPESLGAAFYPGALAGMLSYNFIEEGEKDSNFIVGSVNSASVAFHAQHWSQMFGWTTHMGTARGVMD